MESFPRLEKLRQWDNFQLASEGGGPWMLFCLKEKGGNRVKQRMRLSLYFEKHL